VERSNDHGNAVQKPGTTKESQRSSPKTIVHWTTERARGRRGRWDRQSIFLPTSRIYLLTAFRDSAIWALSRSMRGRVLEAFLKAERGLASCGRGSHPRIGRSGSRPSGTKCTGREAIATSFGANAGVGSADPRPKIAKVERREARAPQTRCPPRLVSAAKLAPPALRRPSLWSGKKVQDPGAVTPRDRKTLCLTNGSMEVECAIRVERATEFRSRPATPVERWTMRAGQLVCYLTRTTRVLPTEGPFLS
jgi:hypothetical protein